MLTENELLTRLQNGEDAETIANELIGALNAANKTYTDQKEAEKKAVQKEKDMSHVLDVVFNFVADYYPEYADSVESWRDEVDSLDMIKVVDELIEYLSALKSLNDKLSALEGLKDESAKDDFDFDRFFDDLLSHNKV